jgi:hypothetical protein
VVRLSRYSLAPAALVAALLLSVSSLPVAAEAEPTKPPKTAEPTKTPAPEKTAALGYDVSYPQCGKPLPSKPAFAILGVNGGLAYSGNPCLAGQYAWALTSSSTTQPRVSFYANTGNPGPTVSTHWPAPGTTTPEPCDGSWSTACAYDYGFYAAQDSFNRASSVAGAAAATAAPWWLDVELANSWSSDTATNSASLQGAVALLKSVGVANVGIYAASSHWATIVGATNPSSPQNDPFRALPNWVPGARNAKEASQRCATTLTGGPTKLAQYVSGGFDVDYPCQ